MKTIFKSSFLKEIKKIKDKKLKNNIVIFSAFDHRKDIYKHFP